MHNLAGLHYSTGGFTDQQMLEQILHLWQPTHVPESLLLNVARRCRAVQVNTDLWNLYTCFASRDCWTFSAVFDRLKCYVALDTCIASPPGAADNLSAKQQAKRHVETPWSTWTCNSECSFTGHVSW